MLTKSSVAHTRWTYLRIGNPVKQNRLQSESALPPYGNPSGCEKDAHTTAADIARRSYGKLVAFLAARTRDVAAAEDALSEAFAAALSDWRRNGCPANPEAWLLTVARRRTIDLYRRQRNEVSTEELDMSESLEAA